jgi:sporulation protein YlmC with PRC-barrel domain
VTNGQIIAKVEDVLLDPGTLRVAALVTTGGGLGNLLKSGRRTEAIPGDEVQVWGQDVVLVSGPDVIAKIEELPASDQWVSVSEQIKGRDVISADGTRVGQLNDVVIDLKGQLVGYDLARVFVEGPPAQSKRIGVEATRTLGQDVLIVDMAEIVAAAAAEIEEEEDTAEIVDTPPEEPIALDTTEEDPLKMDEGESVPDEGVPRIV